MPHLSTKTLGGNSSIKVFDSGVSSSVGKEIISTKEIPDLQLFFMRPTTIGGTVF